MSIRAINLLGRIVWLISFIYSLLGMVWCLYSILSEFSGWLTFGALVYAVCAVFAAFMFSQLRAVNE